MLIRPVTAADTSRAIELWTEAGLVRPWNDPQLDIERKLTVQPELFLVVEIDGEVVATAMAGYEGHRGWVNYLAVATSHRGRGIARALMTRIETELEARGCPKLNLQVRADNADALGFYRALGYEPDGSISLGKRLIAD